MQLKHDVIVTDAPSIRLT